MDKSNYTYEALQKKYNNFITPAVEIQIDGESYNSVEVPIINLEVEITADGGAGGCTFTIGNQYKPEQSQWKNSLSTHVKPGASLSVKIGYENKKEVFYGYVDEYTMSYDGIQGVRITVTGIDGLGYLMSLREPLYGGNQKAKALVESILTKSKNAGFAKKITVGSMSGFDTPVVKEQIDDWTFLNLMARRYGMTLFAIDGELIFDDVIGSTSSLMTLGVKNGLQDFTKRVSLAHQVGKVEVWGRDVNQKPVKGTADSVSVGESSKSSAKEHMSALKSAVVREYSEFVRTDAECKLLAQNRLNEIAMGLVSGEGTCIGIPEIIPGRYITIEELPANCNGLYFISRVKHIFDSGLYTTSFEIKGAKT